MLIEKFYVIKTGRSETDNNKIDWYEDIEIELENGKYILAQAKAVERASDDFSNVRKNMKKAITIMQILFIIGLMERR